MILLWMLLGISAAIALIVSYYWIKFGAPKIVLFTGLSGVLIFLFSVAWAIISIMDGELSNAIFGLIAFGCPGILLVFAGWKILEFKNSHN